MNKTFNIVGGNRYGEAHVMQKYGFVEVADAADADIIVFTGGADINPEIYNDATHPTTYFNSDRDRHELAAWDALKDSGKVFFGICRGAQLLNCLAGGKLYQDINHPGAHYVTTDTGERFLSNSVHHQMLRVAEGAIIKAWAENLSDGHHLYMQDGVEANDEVVEKEPEIVLYPEHRMVLVQGHPEFSSSAVELEQFRQFVFNLVKEA